MEKDDKFSKYRKEEEKPTLTAKLFSKESFILFGLLILAAVLTAFAFPNIQNMLATSDSTVPVEEDIQQRRFAGRHRDILVRQEGKALVTYIDVGQGDAVLIETPNGHVALYDGGEGNEPDNPYGRSTNAGERIILPMLRAKGIERINTLIISHPHSDHIGGFVEILRQFPVDTLIDPGYPATTNTYRTILELVKERDIEYIVPEPGQILDWGSDVFVQVLSADGSAGATNNSSVVLLFQYGDIRTILAGDAYVDLERDLILKYGENLRSHIFKASHHGSRTSNSEIWYEALKPEVTVIGVGGYNRYGHPSPEVVSRMVDYGSRIYRTDEHGHIYVDIALDSYEVITAESLF